MGLHHPPIVGSLSSCCLFVIVLVASCHRHSTCDPPHEQLLARLGAGGVFRRHCPPPHPVSRGPQQWWWRHPLPPCHCSPLSSSALVIVGSSLSTSDPPCEQGLAMVGLVLVVGLRGLLGVLLCCPCPSCCPRVVVVSNRCSQ